MLLILTAKTHITTIHEICDVFVAAKLTVGAEITAVGPSAKKRKTEEDCYTLTVKHSFFIEKGQKRPLLNLPSFDEFPAFEFLNCDFQKQYILGRAVRYTYYVIAGQGKGKLRNLV